ncbi:electron transfer flavoprotein subunit alpha/FixB family protein [Sinimarinibacterium sp. CAU 1509]|uniref:electron transfer flavoprotein subunit alpha/FixB family protein n=1 Tax=Sinimarinibacterium sp. CAU 1509 TaxID=2562283 RepID=UPI0010AC2017|nr:electron transfer flavoprotein subunit alpha/FixB family protein [Sinimarinibacterium sp. CAU 1509]TJY60865.1 electron transfer flavoprotein subunit alpha/FixB family protein [Sinimarinibacterium sp. CAU 1509]
MSKILIIAEHAEGKLNAGVSKTVAAAKGIGGDIHIAVLAADPAGVAAEAAKLDGVAKVITVANPANANPVAAVLAPQIVELAKDGYSHVLFPGGTFGKDLAPRVAAKLDVHQVSDIMAVHSATSFDRPTYAGNAITTVEAPAGIIVATVRLASFTAVGAGNSAAVEAATVSATLPSHTRYVKLEAQKSERPDLQSAARVVSGGRALGSSENFKVVYDFADKIGAGVGASRAAVDSGYVPNDMQVGQTGKIIAPELYFAVGISGAIQHLAGIKDARTIVAINKDPEAPIFEVADFGLVGDLFQVLPEMTSKL